MTAYTLGIDPGYTQSAFVLIDDDTLRPRGVAGIRDNLDVLDVLDEHNYDGRPHTCTLAIEMVSCYGQRVGAEIFDTCRWIGRFQERWGRSCKLIERRAVKQYLGVTKGGDAAVRAVMIDRYGPGKRAAIGLKRSPGPLYGLSRDMWAALAVAFVAVDGKNT